MADTVFTPSMVIGSSDSHEGSLGCFARLADESQAYVLLGNAHVLFGENQLGKNIKIVESPGSSCCHGAALAYTLGTWTGGFSSVTVKVAGIAEEQVGSETDCAIAKIEPERTITNVIPQIGPITGAASGLGVTSFDVFGSESGRPAEADLVRFYSVIRKKIIYGVVVKQTLSATYVGEGKVDPSLYPMSSRVKFGAMKPLINQLQILPICAPDIEDFEENTFAWCIPGESGSVVVNAAREVVGLVTAGSPFDPPDRADDQPHPPWIKAVYRLAPTEELPFGGTGYVCPIGKVMAQLASQGLPITIPSDLPETKVPTPARGARVFVTSEIDDESLDRGRERVAAILRRSRIGTIILAKLRQHGREVRQLVGRDRRAQATWHRYRGAAYLQHYLRNLRDPRHRVPDSIDGVTRSDALAAMIDVLANGSPAHARDVARYRALMLAHAPRLATLDHAGDVIADAHRELTQR